ncbi:MAG: hypothetical protein JWO33_504 [Caulobacteraceae bacterium]|nr:hypothetical protein [Caulobacteraceae bacterium]
MKLSPSAHRHVTDSVTRYYFDALNGQTFADAEGIELPDLGAARCEAVGMLGSLLRGDPSGFWSTGALSILVKDAMGRTLFVVEATAFSISPNGARRRDPDVGAN